jgi:hypothetical protein
LDKQTNVFFFEHKSIPWYWETPSNEITVELTPDTAKPITRQQNHMPARL